MPNWSDTQQGLHQLNYAGWGQPRSQRPANMTFDQYTNNQEALGNANQQIRQQSRQLQDYADKDAAKQQQIQNFRNYAKNLQQAGGGPGQAGGAGLSQSSVMPPAGGAPPSQQGQVAPQGDAIAGGPQPAPGGGPPPRDWQQSVTNRMQGWGSNRPQPYGNQQYRPPRDPNVGGHYGGGGGVSDMAYRGPNPFEGMTQSREVAPGVHEMTANPYAFGGMQNAMGSPQQFQNLMSHTGGGPAGGFGQFGGGGYGSGTNLLQQLMGGGGMQGIAGGMSNAMQGLRGNMGNGGMGGAMQGLRGMGMGGGGMGGAMGGAMQGLRGMGMGGGGMGGGAMGGAMQGLRGAMGGGMGGGGVAARLGGGMQSMLPYMG